MIYATDLELQAARAELAEWEFERARLRVRMDLHTAIHSGPDVLKTIEDALVKSSLAVLHLEKGIAESVASRVGAGVGALAPAQAGANGNGA